MNARQFIEELLRRDGQGSKRLAGDRTTDWVRLLDRRDVLILDTETTGFSKEPEVVEIGTIDTTGSERFHALSIPQEPISSQATQVHGLTRQILQKNGACPWPELHEKLCSVLDEAEIVIAYNASFDKRLIQKTSERHGLSVPSVKWRCAMQDYASHWRKCRLEQAVMREGCPRTQKHRAVDDCQMTLAVMRAVASKHL